MNESFRTRGGLWVIGQSVLMLAVLALGVAYRAEWDGATSLATGTFLGLAGAWLGIAGVRALSTNRTAVPKTLAGSKLVQTGVYGLVRHPLYASVILLSTAWSLLWRSMPAAIATAALVILLDAKARCEERWLREMFASYAACAQRVRQLIPWVY